MNDSDLRNWNDIIAKLRFNERVAVEMERLIAEIKVMLDVIRAADAMRETLSEIAGSKSLTATPTQFYQHLQRIAAKATEGPYDAARAKLEEL